MTVINILGIIATVALWAVIPFQWWSIIVCHKSTKRMKQKSEDLDRLISAYKEELSKLEKGQVGDFD